MAAAAAAVGTGAAAAATGAVTLPVLAASAGAYVAAEAGKLVVKEVFNWAIAPPKNVVRKQTKTAQNTLEAIEHVDAVPEEGAFALSGWKSCVEKKQLHSEFQYKDQKDHSKGKHDDHVIIDLECRFKYAGNLGGEGKFVLGLSVTPKITVNKHNKIVKVVIHQPDTPWFADFDSKIVAISMKVDYETKPAPGDSHHGRCAGSIELRISGDGNINLYNRLRE